MQDKQRNIIWRFALLFGAVLIGFIAVIVKIIILQYFERDQWESIAADQIRPNQIVEATRGNILDKDGNLLATSLPQYTIRMDTRVEALHQKNGELFYQYVDSISAGLSAIIGDKSASEYKQMMVNAYHGKTNKQKDIKLSSKRLNYLQKKQIQQLPLVCRGVYKSGITFEEMHQRNKPFGSLASRTIGTIFGDGGHGSAGLEKQFDNYLTGQDGVANIQRVAGHYEPVTVKEAVNGYDIETTLDVNLMDICEAALRQRVEMRQADWGCCILMETGSGKIRAISNLDRTSDGRYLEMRNHAVSRVEPGSTFKTIALVAAMDDGKVGLYDTVSVSRNGWDFGVAHHTDSHPKDTVYTTRSALAISSNIALAKIITRSYDKKASKFVDKLRRMGICDSVYSEIPGSQPPRIDVPKDAVTLSKMAYGYSVELTPMQILTFYNGIANDGKMIRPYLVTRILNKDEVVEEFHTEVLKSSMCSRGTLEDIRLALHDVVWDDRLGTASVSPWGQKKAQSDLVAIAGKTGTAQLFHHGHYHNREHRMTFVGYFPEENPKYTCLCMIEHPQAPYDAGMDCGYVVREIAEKTMVYAGHYTIKNGEKVYEIK